MIPSSLRIASGVVLLVFVSLLPACSSRPANPAPQIEHPITSEIAGNYSLYAMMSANAEHEDRHIRFPVEMLGWQQVYAPRQPTTGPTTRHSLANVSYDILYNEKEARYVFAFRAGSGVGSQTSQPSKEL